MYLLAYITFVSNANHLFCSLMPLKKVKTVLIAEFASVFHPAHFRTCDEGTLNKSDTVQRTDKDVFPPLPGLFKLFGCFLNIGQSLQFGQRRENCNYLLRGKKNKTSCVPVLP